MTFRRVAWQLGAILALAAPSMLAVPLRLRLVDDRGIQIEAAVKVCLNRGLDTICLEHAPYDVSPSMQDFDSLTAEGPAHGPIQVDRGSLGNLVAGEVSVRISRKAALAIHGLPSDGVALSLYPGDDSTFRKAAFRFENVKAEGLRIPARRFLLALSDGRNAPDLHLLTVKPGGKYSLVYHRRPGWSLLFRSVGTASSPVGGVGAVLVSAAAPGKERELLKTKSEDDGLGVLTGVTEPFATLSLSAAGYLRASTPGLTAGRGTFAFREVALERGGNVIADVTLDGAPALRAACQIASTQRKRTTSSALPSADVLAEVRVADSGRCETPRFPRGEYVFRVIPKDATNSDDEVITLPEDQTIHLEVKLRRYAVSGTVRRGDKPEVGAVVLVTNDEDFPAFGRSAPPEPLKLETDEEGRYSGTVWRSGHYTFSVASKAMVAGGFKEVEVGYDGATVDFELNENDISGVAVDQTDQPVVDSVVTLSKRISDGWEHRWAWTDETGAFKFPLEGSGQIELKAEKVGYRDSESTTVEVSEGAVIPPQRLVMERLDRIEGHVLWPSGGGASGVGVATYNSEPNRVPFNAGSVLTESDGHFSVAKAPGPKTRVFVTGPGCPLQVADVVDSGEDVKLPCASVSSGLEITMKKSDGSALQDERVLLRWNGVLIPRAVLASHLSFLAMQDGTDGAGRLTIVALPPGDYEVFLWSGSSEATISGGLSHGFVSAVSLAPMETAELEVQLE